MEEIERRVSEICRTRLGYDRLDPEENLVERGVDSLLAAEIIARLEVEFGMELVETFFAGPTVRHLATEIARRGVGAQATA